jgi:hypothetical protein
MMVMLGVSPDARDIIYPVRRPEHEEDRTHQNYRGGQSQKAAADAGVRCLPDILPVCLQDFLHRR